MALVRARATHHQFGQNDLSLNAKARCWDNFALNLLRTNMHCMFPKAVHVRSYVRFRAEKLEHVCEHCRSYPGQSDNLI